MNLLLVSRAGKRFWNLLFRAGTAKDGCEPQRSARVLNGSSQSCVLSKHVIHSHEAQSAPVFEALRVRAVIRRLIFFLSPSDPTCFGYTSTFLRGFFPYLRRDVMCSSDRPPSSSLMMKSFSSSSPGCTGKLLRKMSGSVKTDVRSAEWIVLYRCQHLLTEGMKTR